MYDRTTTLSTFLDAAAAKQPTPGGGSVAALCGALGASMGEMVVHYSLGKKSLAAFESDFRAALEELYRARMLMLELMVEDQQAYAALTAAKNLPPGADRDAQYAAALQAALGAPEAIGATAVAILRVCDGIVDKANIYLLSDLAVCTDMAMATARCAVYNIRVNMTEIADVAERKRIGSRSDEMLAHALTLIQRIGPRIWARIGAGQS